MNFSGLIFTSPWTQETLHYYPIYLFDIYILIVNSYLLIVNNYL